MRYLTWIVVGAFCVVTAGLVLSGCSGGSSGGGGGGGPPPGTFDSATFDNATWQ